VELLVAAILIDAVCTYVCFQKGRTGLAWVGVVGLFGLAPILLWFPLAGMFGPASPDSPWGRKQAEHGLTPGYQPTPPVIPGAPIIPSIQGQVPVSVADPFQDPARREAIITSFLADARDRGVVDEDAYRRLLAMVRPDVVVGPLATAAAIVESQPDLAQPVSSPQEQTALTPPPLLPSQPRPVPPPIVPSVPREPSKAAQTRARLWSALKSDIAVHGFSYLGVVLTFVAVLGFLLFAFADLPDNAQPFVELGIALIFFGWTWVLRRQDAVNVANGMELIGGMVLPLILFASLVDNAPFPPDFEGAGLVVALTVSSLVLAVLYSLYTARRLESVLRYLVAPLLWLGALTLGFAFKTDEPLVGDAITRLVSPQPALASLAIALTLVASMRRPENRLAQPTVTSALVGLPVAYLLTVALAFGEDWARTWPLAVLGVGTLISAEILARWYEKGAWLSVMRPLLLAAVLVPLVPSLRPGWAGLIVAVAYVAVFELDRRLAPTAGVGQLLAGLGAAVGAVMAWADPWTTLIVFTGLTAWAHVRRFETWEPAGVGTLFTVAAAALPIGIGSALLRLIDPGVAWLVMSAILVAGVVVIRVLKDEDPFWPIWLGVASLIVALGTGLSWGQRSGVETLAAPAIALTAVAIALIPRWPIPRLWVSALLADLAVAVALETAGTSPDRRAQVWAGIGFALVLGANLVRRSPASHLAAVGHLIAAGAMLGLPTGSTRAIVVSAFALGWVITTIGGELGGDSVTSLLARLESSLNGSDQPSVDRIAIWVAPILMTASIPFAALTVAQLWETADSELAWSALALTAVAIAYAAVARLIESRQPLSRILITGGMALSLVAIGVSLPDSWSAIITCVGAIGVAMVAGKGLRQFWFLWAAWTVSVFLVALLADKAGVAIASLSQVTLVWGAIMLVAGLASDDALSERRQRLELVRVEWLQPPVFIGAGVLALSLAHVFSQPADVYGWWAIGSAVVIFAVAWLLRIGAVTGLGYALLTVGVAAVSPWSFTDKPWLFAIPAAVFVAAAWVIERLRPAGPADGDWMRWDLPPLFVAHLIGAIALAIAFETEVLAPTALAFGGLALLVGMWRQGRAWIEVGNLLLLVAAFDTGPGWLALALGATSLRGVIGAWRSTGVERLSYDFIGTLSAGLAWIAVIDWQGYTTAEAVGYTALVFGGLALVVGVAARVSDLPKDTLAIWGGLGVAGVIIDGIFAFGLDQPEQIGPWLAVGFAMLAISFELAWRRLSPSLRLLTVVASGLAWLTLVVGLGWDSTTVVRTTVVVFGLIAFLSVEIARIRPLIHPSEGDDSSEGDDFGLAVARAWVGLGAVGVAVAAFGYPGEGSDAYVIALGMLLLSIGLARGADPLRLGLLRAVSAITTLVAIDMALGASDLSQPVIAVVLVVFAAATTFLSLWLWKQQRAALWVTPLVVLAVAVNVETGFLALRAWPDRSMVVAVLLSLATQTVAIGLIRSLPGVLALGPPTAGLAFILAIGEYASGSAQWYTVPVALVLLVEVEILRAVRRAAGEDEGKDAVILEWAGIALLAAPPLVEMFTTQLAYGFMAFAVAAAIFIWAIVTKMRRRAVAAASIAIATAVLLIFAAAAGAAPESAAIWILAGGIGFAVMLVAALVEAYRTRRGHVMVRADQLMQGWK
jgi:hypothetical protein